MLGGWGLEIWGKYTQNAQKHEWQTLQPGVSESTHLHPRQSGQINLTLTPVFCAPTKPGQARFLYWPQYWHLMHPLPSETQGMLMVIVCYMRNILRNILTYQRTHKHLSFMQASATCFSNLQPGELYLFMNRVQALPVRHAGTHQSVEPFTYSHIPIFLYYFKASEETY